MACLHFIRLYEQDYLNLKTNSLLNLDEPRCKPKSYNLKKKNKNNGNDKGNKKPMNLNWNYINSTQIYEGSKFLKNHYFLNVNLNFS